MQRLSQYLGNAPSLPPDAANEPVAARARAVAETQRLKDEQPHPATRATAEESATHKTHTNMAYQQMATSDAEERITGSPMGHIETIQYSSVTATGDVRQEKFFITKAGADTWHITKQPVPSVLPRMQAVEAV